MQSKADYEKKINKILDLIINKTSSNSLDWIQRNPTTFICNMSQSKKNLVLYIQKVTSSVFGDKFVFDISDESQDGEKVLSIQSTDIDKATMYSSEPSLTSVATASATINALIASIRTNAESPDNNMKSIFHSKIDQLYECVCDSFYSKKSAKLDSIFDALDE